MASSQVTNFELVSDIVYLNKVESQTRRIRMALGLARLVSLLLGLGFAYWGCLILRDMFTYPNPFMLPLPATISGLIVALIAFIAAAALIAFVFLGTSLVKFFRF